MVKQIGEPTEEGHFLKWMEPIQAVESLFHDHQSWAINEVLEIL